MVNGPKDVKNTLGDVYTARRAQRSHANQLKNSDDQSDVASSTDTSARARPKDEFLASAASSEVDRVKEQFDRLPDVDEIKVAKLREDIRNGTFRIDSREVADKMLEVAADIKPRD